jgi:hypothetical protein
MRVGLCAAATHSAKTFIRRIQLMKLSINYDVFGSSEFGKTRFALKKLVFIFYFSVKVFLNAKPN